MVVKKKSRRRREPSTPVMRAWHVVMASGGDQTVTAHHCDNYAGGLSFVRRLPRKSTVLVRAFAPGAWHDVELVEPIDRFSEQQQGHGA